MKMAQGDADFKDFSKFMRFFCTRMCQIVVQARMGKMHATPCSANPEQSNWFNLAIDEIGEVAAYLKSTIGRNYPPTIPVLSLEFILYTSDNEKLPLETWVVRLDKECQDWDVKVQTTLYQQLSTLLKSIIVASRFTPTYRYYVRNQGPETFVIIYRVYEGEPDLSILGEEVKYRRLGSLPSPFGTITVELHFRTKMEIQPQPFVEEGTAKEAEIKAKTQEIPIGIAVPTESSQIVPVSPASTEDINLFSTSPISQDLPFRAKSPNFTIGRSLSATDTMDRNQSPKPDEQHSSPPTSSSSFPQRNSMQKLRMRNNSFPFASLLLYSQSSSDQLKTLPNVPEDAALNTAVLSESHKSGHRHEEGGGEGGGGLRKNSSIGIEMVCLSNESTTTNRPAISSQDFDESRPSTSKVVFGCGNGSEYNKEDEATTTSKQEEKEGDKDVDIDSSDDSYVKVMAFAGGADDELGSDLGEFFKEIRLAPEHLRSFGAETSAADFGRQLNDFRQQETAFRQFVTKLRDQEEEEEEEE